VIIKKDSVEKSQLLSEAGRIQLKKSSFERCCRELGRVLHMARNELEYAKKTSCVISRDSETYESVARIRLAKTENSSACVAGNCIKCVNQRECCIACSPEF
jgi:hypothetical protein